MKVVTYQPVSNAAKELARLLDPVKAPFDLNWGDPYPGYRGAGVGVLNADISAARCKRAALRRFDLYGVPTVEWTVHLDVALRWRSKFYARMDGLSNRNGMRLADEGDVINPKPEALALDKYDFYTKYIPDMRDYRVHVVFDEAIGYQVLSDDNKLVVIEETKAMPDHVARYMRRAAVQAVRALNLDFGAVDFGVRPDWTFVIFEVNTAPSIGAVMQQRYADAFRAALTK